jgi:hypothetical protein
LNTELKLQKAKNVLIKNLEKDMEKVSELITLEEDLEVFKDEMDEISTLLDERVEIEKETLKIKNEDVTRSHYFFNFILLIFPLILYTMKYNLLL